MDILPQLPEGCVDLCLSDPPYGIDWDTNYSRFSRGTADKAPIENDTGPFDPAPLLGFPEVILFGGNHFADKLPPASWLIWDKRNADGTSFLADGEAAWWNKGRGIYIKSFSGQYHRSTAGGFHPTQKPVVIMEWCLEKSKSTGIVLDPYAGSCTTAVACRRLNRQWICIEIDEGYCRIAKDRIQAEQKGISVKELKQGQGVLFEKA